jgi:hypothetical protein
MNVDKYSYETAWARLSATVRRFPLPLEAEPSALLPPPGFATRVVVHARLDFANDQLQALKLERLARRACGLASVCALAATVWANLPTTNDLSGEEIFFVGTASAAALDPVGALLEAAQP